MMPLTNVWSKNPQAVHFQLRSFSMCFAVIFLMLGGIKTTRIGIKVFQGGLNAKNMVSLVFFSSGICICIGFILFARNWSRLIVPWSSIDIIMLYPPYAPTKRSLHRQLLMSGGMLGAVALVEHFLYYASSYYSYQMHVVQCDKNLTNTLFVSYMEHEFSDIFDFLPYNELVIFYAFFLNSTFTFIWNFMDTFIILISIGLAQRFQQFATRVLTLEHCFVPETLWFNLRQHHILLCELVELVDAHLSHIILFSCLNNIYFICNKILAIFTKLRYGINHAYFWYSLIFLLGRTCAVFLCASKIHDASLLPLQVVYAVPSNSWSEEVQRFTHQLHNQ
ncbi:Gr61a [Drosophila busckii]|uniref:Gr61a n=1 Tax=Drosophila busckii TaxID=30019 RepID=A0A0M4E912_DROBS|nr:Gr61a [Drosophila busckii]